MTFVSSSHKHYTSQHPVHAQLLLLLTLRNQLLKSPEIHILLQKRNDIWIKSLPVRVLKVILLRPLIEITLHDTEVLLIMDRLHNEPGESLLILRVNGRGLQKLRVELGDRLLVGLRAHVDNDCVDHFGQFGDLFPGVKRGGLEG